MNSAVIAVVMSGKELRKWQFFPVGLQAFIDIISSGIPAFLISLAQIEYTKPYTDGPSNFLYSWLLRDTPLRNWGWCVAEYLRLNFNELGSSLCILVIACERFILVCLPFRAQEILTTRSRMKGYSTVIGLLLAYTAFHFLNFHFEWVNSNIHLLTCHADRYNPARTFPKMSLVYSTIIVMFVGPAAVSLALYIAISVALLRKKRNTSKNVSLTIAFFLSMIAWLLLAIPYFAAAVMSIKIRNGTPDLLGNTSLAKLVIVRFLQAGHGDSFLSIYSVLNPAILLVICRPIREHMINCIRRLYPK